VLYSFLRFEHGAEHCFVTPDHGQSRVKAADEPGGLRVVVPRVHEVQAGLAVVLLAGVAEPGLRELDRGRPLDGEAVDPTLEARTPDATIVRPRVKYNPWHPANG